MQTLRRGESFKSNLADYFTACLYNYVDYMDSNEITLM